MFTGTPVWLKEKEKVEMEREEEKSEREEEIKETEIKRLLFSLVGLWNNYRIEFGT